MTDRPPMRSAAWRISLWATLAFACGTMVVFVFIDRFVAHDIQRRSDAWLSGEVEVLGDVAGRTPNNALYNRVVGEVAELAAREVPNKAASSSTNNDSVFFIQTGSNGALKLWVGEGNSEPYLHALRERPIQPDKPTSVRVKGTAIPFRVASIAIGDGSRIFLGLSERDELHVLQKLQMRFFLLWLSVVLLGFAIAFFTSRRTLSHVRSITEAASRIGHWDLNSRVPTSSRNDEIAHLAITLNRMLDRIENSMHQLHTITDSLAHDLRSPLTAIRGKLETSLLVSREADGADQIVSAIDEIDRLTDFLNKSLDVAEAKADALRLTRTEVDLNGLLRAMIDLYEPSMAEHGLKVEFRSSGSARIVADAGLVHRMIANLFDNELKHADTARGVEIILEANQDFAMLTFEDDGPGFDADVRSNLFAGRVKGKNSSGHGLGLAFVDAVARGHGGTVSASNRETGGAQISIRLPLAHTDSMPAPPAIG